MAKFVCDKCGKSNLDFVYFSSKNKELCEKCYEEERAKKIL